MDLYARRRQAREPGSARADQRRRLAGKLTARERIDAVLDPGSFFEVDEFVLPATESPGDPPVEGQSPAYGDGVVAGLGTVHGRQVALYAQDATVLGGSLGAAHGRKILKVMQAAELVGCPMIGLNDSGGARIPEGVDALSAYADLGRAMIRLSGVVPQIIVALGSCAGGAAYGAALADFVVMVDGLSHMFVTGPEIIEFAMGQQVSREELGGARVCCEISGSAHYLAEDEADALDWLRTLLAYLPSNNHDGPPQFDRQSVPQLTELDRGLDRLVPENSAEGYRMEDLLDAVLDGSDFLEVAERYGRSLIVGFGCIDGATVGVVASRPEHAGGALDGDASDKGARFVRFCDAMDIPILTLVDVPGFLPGLEQEHSGILRRGAKLVFAYGEATVPLVTVIVRKAFGGAYGVLGSKQLGADINLAWPSAQIATMGPHAAVGLLHRRELAEIADPLEREQRGRELAGFYSARLGTPYAAANRGHVDRVIAPHETRHAITAAFRILRTKRVDAPRKKHNTMPL